MKKTVKIFTSVLTSALLAVSSLPVFSFAEEHITGDINCDGIVNTEDTFMILRYYAEESIGASITFSDTDIENIIRYGDLTADGKIDAADAAEIISIAVKTLDVNGDGKVDIDDAMYVYDFAVNINSHSLEELEALTKLTASVEYYADAEYVQPELLNYAFSLAKNLTDFKDYKSGDVNGDGNIDASDASDVLGFYSNISAGVPVDELSSKYKYILLGGDYDHNNNINANDASQILSRYAKASSGQ
ncbi:MAG: dockerin type I domain-containing protein [Ruminococcus sp.]